MTEDYGKILEAMAFKSQSKKGLVNRIVNDVLASRDLTSLHYKGTKRSRVRQRVDFYAKQYGNLGITRRKLTGFCMKEIHRCERKAAQERWAEYRERDAS